jgi:hypothetical protein
MAGRPPAEMKCWVVPSSVVAVDALAQVSPHRSLAAGACGT